MDRLRAECREGHSSKLLNHVNELQGSGSVQLWLVNSACIEKLFVSCPSVSGHIVPILSASYINQLLSYEFTSVNLCSPSSAHGYYCSNMAKRHFMAFILYMYLLATVQIYNKSTKGLTVFSWLITLRCQINI